MPQNTPSDQDTLFVFSTGISIKHGNNKNYPDTPSIGNGPVQKVQIGESIWHKRVNQGE